MRKNRPAGGYVDPDQEENWNLQLVISVNKVRAMGAHHRAAKRDVRRTVSGDVSSAVALLGLVVDEVLGRLPDGHRPVVRLRIEGHEPARLDRYRAEFPALFADPTLAAEPARTPSSRPPWPASNTPTSSPSTPPTKPAG